MPLLDSVHVRTIADFARWLNAKSMKKRIKRGHHATYRIFDVFTL